METIKYSPTILKRISPYTWEIAQDFTPNMHVPARIYATERMLNDIFRDKAVEQLINVTMLPGIVHAALAMPDAHEGYGFPIGGVAATSYPHGVISPGGIGYDINCGVRLLRSSCTLAEIQPSIERLSQRIFHTIPSGVGVGGQIHLNSKDLDALLHSGSAWMLQKGYATPHDIINTESQGCLENANPDKISAEAKKRGLGQLGTIGSGNHFVEIDVVEEVYDEPLAQRFGLWKNQIVVMIHTGSRGLGHQAASDFVDIMNQAMPKYGITVPTPTLACAPLSSPEGADYFSAMAAAANYAWANRQMITYLVRQAWEKEFGNNHELSLLYDVAHNIAKIETHVINGKKQKVIMHRKGATRAFGPHDPEIPAEYQQTGQPVIIPGSMGTASYILAGNGDKTGGNLASCCHGAGRRISRAAAKQEIHGRQVQQNLLEAGIIIQSKSYEDLAEEAPSAYKDIDDVIRVVDGADIARKVVKLKPKAVIKG